MQTLGHISLHMIAAGLTGYMATVANLKDPVHKWRCAAAPLTVTKYKYTQLYRAIFVPGTNWY